MFYCILITLAIAFKEPVPTKALMIIKGDSHKSFVLVYLFAPWLIVHAFLVNDIFIEKFFQKYHKFGFRSDLTFYYQYI